MSSFRQLAILCAMAALVPAVHASEAPSALQHAIARAKTGDVLDITGVNPISLPQASVKRGFSGGTFIYDGSPENIPGPGVTYSDALPPGFVRLMIYHVNASGYIAGATPQNLKLSVVLEPADPNNPPTVTLHRRTVYGPSLNYFYVGREASFNYLSQFDPPADLNTVLTVDKPILLDPDLEASVIDPSSSRPLLEAHYDFDVAGGSVKFSTVALPPGNDTLAAYAALAPLAKDVHDRGTCTGAAEKDITMSTPYSTTSGMQHIRTGGGASDAYGADPYAGQGTPAGHDGITGESTFIKGNFGELYTFRLAAKSGDKRHVAILMNPRGGPISGAVDVNGPSLTGQGVFYAPSTIVSPSAQAVLFARWNPAATPTLSFNWFPPGASSAPVEFILIPYTETGDVDGSGTADLADALLTLRSLNALTTLTASQKIAADVDNDGSVTVADVSGILKLAAGLS